MDVLVGIGERYGLLPVYALVIGAVAFSASSFRNLVTVLVMLSGLYVVMFQAFDLKQTLDIFGLTERFGLTPDIANSIAAVIYVVAIGLIVYGVKRIFVRRKKPAAEAEPKV